MGRTARTALPRKLLTTTACSDSSPGEWLQWATVENARLTLACHSVRHSGNGLGALWLAVHGCLPQGILSLMASSGPFDQRRHRLAYEALRQKVVRRYCYRNAFTALGLQWNKVNEEVKL